MFSFLPSIAHEFYHQSFQLSQVEYLMDIQVFSSFCGTERRNKKEPRTRSAVEQMGFRCLAAELAASPLRQSSPEKTPKSLICYRRLPLSFALLTPRHLSWQTREAVFYFFSDCKSRWTAQRYRRKRLETYTMELFNFKCD